ncbi:unnamed protein product [Aphanomyces euteiches]|uniref:Major facilitator superfamily (MFS) profile domain-containing protein n=1 Tax=Aphanomyces euteiches TaxID=100861 RepID=A0A6G0WDA2_9STRA|nr:hypothetical protein Ae201684_016706 [Aphanomyces euteiches]KAH9083165.1 hypothetical protein Ae201684P_014062 [Aphanomyces euteiches]
MTFWSDDHANAASVVVGSVILFTLGSAYVISAWNNEMKEILHMTQVEIAAVGSCFTFGQFNLLWVGMFYDRFGVRWSTLVAAISLATLYWIASTLATTPAAPHWWMAACFGCIGVAHALPTISGIAATEGLYGEAHRGKIMGLMAASYSGGGAAFAVVYHTWFHHRVSAYFTFMGWTFLVVCLLGAIIIKPTVHPKETDLPSTQPDEETPLHANADITLLPLLRTARFWYLFVSVLVGVGAPLFVMNNLSFLVESNHGDMSQVSALVLLFSLVNLLGRFVMGAVSDAFVSTIPRSRFLSGSIIFVGVTQLLFIVVPVTYIVVPVVLTGLAEGCVFGLFPVLTRELYGARHFGKNYGLIGLANAVGFPLILGPLSSALYRLQLTPGTEKCFGSSCFMPMFFITATLSVIAFVCSTRLR